MDTTFKKHCQITQTASALFYLKENNEVYEMIMHSGLTNFEEKSAEIVSQNGGDILEIGFGMGISANKFLSQNISSYTCIEINDTIFSNAQLWATDKNNVTIINEDWQNYLTDTTIKYDAIYCDYLDSSDYFEFYEKSKNVLKVNGIISTYGGGVNFGIDNMNIYDTITPPTSFDENFTQQVYNRLVLKGFYKIYWQYFDGVNYVKNIN